MIPTNSSATTNGCNNISSNCVIWQGPDITCIDLCNGDSVSEVSIQLINTTLTSYDTRITILEACVLPCSGVVVEKQVIPTCIINVGNLTDVSVLLLALEARFCALETAVGLPSAINSAVSQTVLQGSSSTLTTPTTSYGSITGCT